MTVLIVLCVLCGIEGFRFGMWLAQLYDDANAWFDDYLDGITCGIYVEFWR